MAEETANGGSVRVERLVRPTTPNGPPEHAARVDSGAIVFAGETMLTNSKEDIQSYCPKAGDGPMDDVDSSLIMPGAEMKRCENGRNAILCRWYLPPCIVIAHHRWNNSDSVAERKGRIESLPDGRRKIFG